jgi:hypothetical protein
MTTPAGRRPLRSRGRSSRPEAAIPQDFFLPPPPDAHRARWKSVIPRRARNLALAAAIPIVAIVIAMGMLPSAEDVVADPAPLRESSMDPQTPAPPVSGAAGLRSYSVSAPELQGLSEGALPGTKLELWVAWEPPVTKSPKVQRLVEEVVLEKVVAPTVPEAPSTAVLLVPPEAIPDVIYGDLYGRLSVVTLPD